MSGTTTQMSISTEIDYLARRVSEVTALAVNTQTAVISVLDQAGRLNGGQNAGLATQKLAAMASLAMDQIERTFADLEDILCQIPDGNRELRDAFVEWRKRQFAVFTAEKSQDGRMDALVDRASEARARLMAARATSSDELVLKVYALAIEEFDKGALPMSLGEPKGSTGRAEIWRSIIADLPRVSEAVALTSGMEEAA